jgi:hypothetical protein
MAWTKWMWPALQKPAIWNARQRRGALVYEGLLASEGLGRGMTDRLLWQWREASALVDAADSGGDFLPESIEPPELDTKPPELGTKPPELGTKPPELGTKPPELQAAWAELAKPDRSAKAPPLRTRLGLIYLMAMPHNRP